MGVRYWLEAISGTANSLIKAPRTDRDAAGHSDACSERAGVFQVANCLRYKPGMDF